MKFTNKTYIASAFAIFWLSMLLFPSPASASATVALTECYDRLLKVTAYYTPEVTQGVYFNGNFATEKKINWGNQHGASGRETFNGMLAGPKNFPFGTTVEIPGLGIGGIYDRGSAIISTGSHDVIDVWAGYGLQGLVNALSRGSKMLTGTICPEGFNLTKQGFDRSKYPTWDKASKTLLWSLKMEEGSVGATVYYLQGFLKQLNYLPSSYILNQNFWPVITQALCKFQQDHIGLAADDEACGYYGPQTRKKLLTLLQAKKISILDAPSSTANLITTAALSEEKPVSSAKKVITKRRMLTIR